MKVLLVRLGVLGTVVALGWITIANAQRDNDGGNPLRTQAAASEDPTAAANEPAPSRPPATDPFGLQTRRAPPPTAAGSSDAGDTIPNAASTGLPPPRNDSTPVRSRYAPRPTALASSEASPAGPALNSAAPARPANGTAARNGAASRAGSRYGVPPSATTLPAVSPSDTQEPPRLLRADPSAIPASPALGTAPKRENFVTPPNNRVTEIPAEGEGVGQPGDAQLEGVLAKVEIQNQDVQKLPFRDGFGAGICAKPSRPRRPRSIFSGRGCSPSAGVSRRNRV